MMRSAVFVIFLTLSFTADAAGRGGIGAIFAALVGGAVGNAAGKASTARTSVEDVLPKVADRVNKQLPMTVDRDTRWDTTSAGPGRKFTYHYTIVSARGSEIDAAYFNKTMAGQLRSSVCSSQDLQIFLKHGVTLSYSYRGSDGRPFSTIDIAPQMCGHA
jgi:hypothetical protein